MEIAGKVSFLGSEISGFVPPIVSGNGTYIGELRRNSTTFGLEVWNGTSWKANDGINTSKVQAIPAIQYFLIPNETGNSWITTASEPTNPRYFTDITTCFNTVTALASANPSMRYKITIYPGVYNPTANISILNNMQVELMHGAEIANGFGSTFNINMTNGAITGSGVLNADINSTITSGNLAILHGSYFKKLHLTGKAMVKANIINQLNSFVYADDIFVDAVTIAEARIAGNASIKAHHISFIECTNSVEPNTYRTSIEANTINLIKYGRGLIVNAELIVSANFFNGEGSLTRAGKIVEASNVCSDVTIEADEITTLHSTEDTIVKRNVRIQFNNIDTALVIGQIEFTGNSIKKLVCFSSVGSNADVYPFDVKVNVNQIGNVTTLYGWTYQEYSGYGLNTPDEVLDKNGVPTYCNCTISSENVTCGSKAVCPMRAYFGGLKTVQLPTDVPYIQKSRLNIIANSRMKNSSWLLAVGKTIAYIQQHDNDFYLPNTYIGNSMTAIGDADTANMTILRMSDLNDFVSNGINYQLSGHAALVLNNVNIHSRFYNVTETLYDSNRSSYCGVKDSCLQSDMSNIESNFGTIYTNIQNSFGNTGTNNTTPITGSGNLIINTTDNWM